MTIRDLTVSDPPDGAGLATGPASGGVLAQIEHRLGYLADIGLDYLTARPPGREPRRQASSSASS